MERLAYLMINGNDYSGICNELKVNREVNYNSQMNAAGNTVVEYINAKRIVEVGIIPLDDVAMLSLLADIENFNVSLSFRNPRTNDMETINAIVPSSNIEYYTIQVNKVLYEAMTIQFIEL